MKTAADLKQDLEEIISRTIQDICPNYIIKENIRVFEDEESYHFFYHDQIIILPKPIHIIAVGKAAAAMTDSFLELLSSVKTGLVITKYGHSKDYLFPEHIDVIEAGHPIPDEQSIYGADLIISKLSSLSESESVLFLLSGGASALVVSPIEGISLDDMRILNDLFVKSGANISEINTIRKKIDGVKGGRLLEYSKSNILSFIISDVVGDNLEVIGSGPTYPDDTNFADALEIISKYKLQDRIPKNILRTLNEKQELSINKMREERDHSMNCVTNVLLCPQSYAAITAKRISESLGYSSIILNTQLDIFVDQAANFVRGIVKTIRDGFLPFDVPCCLLFSGELLVHVTGSGLGGRNLEFSLFMADLIKDLNGIYVISLATDGTDGPTESAGAIVSCDTFERAQKMGLDPQNYLKNNDSYSFFDKMNLLIRTGPTGNNLGDLIIVLMGEACH